jgi:predicted dehydrogenase
MNGLKNQFNKIDLLSLSLFQKNIILSKSNNYLLKLLNKNLNINKIVIGCELECYVLEKNNSKAFVALNRRHYSSTLSAIHELDSVQGVRLVNIYDQEDIVSAEGGGHPKVVLKNWMYANSIHVIDYLNIFCRGEILKVDPIVKWNSQDPSFVAAKISFSSGDIGIYQAVWNGPGPWSVVVTTKDKRCELKPLEQLFMQHNMSRIQNLVEGNIWDSKFKPGLRSQAQEAIKAIRGEDHRLPTLEDALKTMRLIKDIYG